MSTTTLALTSQNRELDLSPGAFGELRRSTDLAHDAAALRERMRADGYLFLPGWLRREEVLAARQVITDRLAAAGHLDPAFSASAAVASPTTGVKFMPELARDNPALSKVLYAGPMMELFARLLGGTVRHYDFTWFRAVSPGLGTPPHADVPYMGRGTHDLFTAWTPFGDVDFEQGGLMILEDSPRHVNRLRKYLNKDVDAYCTNGPFAADIEAGKRMWGAFDGWLTKDPVGLREKLGSRWLTTEFAAGDVLIFSVYTIHASLDNHSKRIRLSSDSRYQLASEPVDERWIGKNPVGHGAAGKRGRIC